MELGTRRTCVTDPKFFTLDFIFNKAIMLTIERIELVSCTNGINIYK